VSRLIVNVARPRYGEFCGDAIKHGALDVHIISSTDTEYRVEMTVAAENMGKLKRGLGLATGQNWHVVR